MSVQLTRKTLPTMPTANSGMAAMFADHQRHLRAMKNVLAKFAHNPGDAHADKAMEGPSDALWVVTEKILDTAPKSVADLAIKARVIRTRWELNGDVDIVEEMLSDFLDEVIALSKSR